MLTASIRADGSRLKDKWSYFPFCCIGMGF